ncbi:hypothetical protein FACS1894142_4210 [Spirochaetia bacterium]|nr:hypothetical protein FACS1894142_4210 [Spirochaetia bacterium]
MHNMDKRSLFYWGKQYVKNMDAGAIYNKLPNVIAINIVDFDYIKLDDFHTSFHLREDKNSDYILTDAIEIHFINMAKFRKLENKDIKNDALVRWLTYLDETTPPEIIKEVVKMDTAIEKTNERYDFLSQDKETLHRYHLRQIGQMDWNSVVYERDQNRIAKEQAEKRAEQAEHEWEQAKKRITELEAQLRTQLRTK